MFKLFPYNKRSDYDLDNTTNNALYHLEPWIDNTQLNEYRYPY